MLWPMQMDARQGKSMLQQLQGISLPALTKKRSRPDIPRLMAAVAHKVPCRTDDVGHLLPPAEGTGLLFSVILIGQGTAAYHAAGKLLRPGSPAFLPIHAFAAAPTAIISAQMLTAISSGVSAPMFRPMGEWTASSSSWVKPSSFSRAMVAATFFRLPIIPT